MVLNIDFASTISELAGVKPRLPQDGQSLLPLLHGKSPPWRHDFIVEYLGASQFEDGGPPPFQAPRSTRWLYVEYTNGWRELYDLRHDPYELQNVAADRRNAAIERQLARRLHALAAR